MKKLLLTAVLALSVVGSVSAQYNNYNNSVAYDRGYSTGY
jgi:hypothetical protein